MPHTTTKGLRTKRVDVRPNAKQRKEKAKKAESQKIIQDIRVTKTLKSERKERSTGPGQNLVIKKSTHEIVLRSLRKKMQAIDDLLEKQRNGKVLDAQQLQKIDTLDAVLAEMEKYSA